MKKNNSCIIDDYYDIFHNINFSVSFINFNGYANRR